MMSTDCILYDINKDVKSSPYSRGTRETPWLWHRQNKMCWESIKICFNYVCLRYMYPKNLFWVDKWKWYKIYLETLKKSSQNFAIFFVGSQFFMTQDWQIMIFEAGFRQNGTLFRKWFFSGIHKYLNGHVLCLQFFDFRFSLDFSLDQNLMKKWQKRLKNVWAKTKIIEL